jgi:hypothetical protein
MRKWMMRALFVLPLVAGGVVFATSRSEVAKPVPAPSGYICPITGEELPCPNCCPLNNGTK